MAIDLIQDVFPAAAVSWTRVRSPLWPAAPQIVVTDTRRATTPTHPRPHGHARDRGHGRAPRDSDRGARGGQVVAQAARVVGTCLQREMSDDYRGPGVARLRRAVKAHRRATATATADATGTSTATATAAAIAASPHV